MSNQLETLYYDGLCPLCNAKMARLGAYQPVHLKLVDIHQVEMDEEYVIRLRPVPTDLLGLQRENAIWPFVNLFLPARAKPL